MRNLTALSLQYENRIQSLDTSNQESVNQLRIDLVKAYRAFHIERSTLNCLDAEIDNKIKSDSKAQ